MSVDFPEAIFPHIKCRVGGIEDMKKTLFGAARTVVVHKLIRLAQFPDGEGNSILVLNTNSLNVGFQAPFLRVVFSMSIGGTDIAKAMTLWRL